MRKWNAKRMKTRQDVRAVMSHVTKKEYVANACATISAKGSFLLVAFQKRQKVAMIGALNLLSERGACDRHINKFV